MTLDRMTPIQQLRLTETLLLQSEEEVSDLLDIIVAMAQAVNWGFVPYIEIEPVNHERAFRCWWDYKQRRGESRVFEDYEEIAKWIKKSAEREIQRNPAARRNIVDLSSL